MNSENLAVSEKPHPLADFNENLEKADSENTLKDFEETLNQKEEDLVKRYEKSPENVEKVHTFFREQREALRGIREKLKNLLAQHEGKKEEAEKSISDLLKPFLDSTLESTAGLEKGIDNSIEAMNTSVADAVAEAAEIVSQNPALTEGGVCEQYSDAVKKIAMEQLDPAAREFVLNWQEPLAPATHALRGTLVSQLTPESLTSAGVQPGMVFYVASKEKYAAHGVSIDSKSDGVIAKIDDTDRHWFTALDNGLFADNLGTKPRSLAEIQGSVGDRIVMNIHDPYQKLRGGVS